MSEMRIEVGDYYVTRRLYEDEPEMGVCRFYCLIARPVDGDAEAYFVHHHGFPGDNWDRTAAEAFADKVLQAWNYDVRPERFVNNPHWTRHTYPTQEEIEEQDQRDIEDERAGW